MRHGLRGFRVRLGFHTRPGRTDAPADFGRRGPGLPDGNEGVDAAILDGVRE